MKKPRLISARSALVHMREHRGWLKQSSPCFGCGEAIIHEKAKFYIINANTGRFEAFCPDCAFMVTENC